MKHLIITLLVVLFSATLGFGREWKPFVSASGVMDVPSSEVAYEWNVLRFATSDYIYPGTQFEVGVQNEKHEWFFAYHLSHSPQLNDYSSSWSGRTDSSDIWLSSSYQTFRSEQKFFFGHRFWPTGHMAKVNPYVGMAVGLGYSRRRTNTQTYRVEEILDSTRTHHADFQRELYGQSQYSEQDNTYGGMVELGTSFKTWKTVELLLITQLHVYTIRQSFWGVVWYDWYMMPSGVLQLRYVFR